MGRVHESGVFFLKCQKGTMGEPMGKVGFAKGYAKSATHSL